MLSFSSSSCSVVGQISPQHQVFINFRGKELRKGFVSFLVPALRNENVNFFIDETEMRSRDLQHIFRRIEESSVAVVIFSALYTESKWCLDELVKINERMIEGKLKVIPIFFKVTVDNVKTLEGEFGTHFRETKRRYRDDLDRIHSWEEALKSIPQKFGLPSSEYRTDYDLVNKIVVEVKKLLNHIPMEEAAAPKVNRYTKEKQAPPQTKKRVTSLNLTMEEKWKPEDYAWPIGELIRFTGKEEEMKCHYEKFEFHGKQYGLEDSVLLIPEVPTRSLYPAIIKDIYKQVKDGCVYLEVQWFYRPEEAEKKDGGSWDSTDSQQMFYSFHRDEVVAESVKQKCTVHFLSGNEQIPKQPGFIVQNVYDVFNKKLWKLTDEDFEKNQKQEIDLLVANTKSQLGDLLDIDKEQKTPKLKGKRSTPKRRRLILL